ncbi:hypothetical protein, partial [Escherichia coli]|uniref:hypothetical protein n=1 Tax=Escherichia coli TaxID=562 RepID=UPI0025A5808F
SRASSIALAMGSVMDGKKSPLEFLEQKLKLQGGTLGPIQIATKAVRKYGTVQMTGVYGGLE